ncbi:MAG TPA: hypothetical protein VFJ06_03175 [Halococcus sp.]|nr:hypothetical protein [Halococcus sp.]
MGLKTLETLAQGESPEYIDTETDGICGDGAIRGHRPRWRSAVRGGPRRMKGEARKRSE